MGLRQSRHGLGRPRKRTFRLILRRNRSQPISDNWAMVSADCYGGRAPRMGHRPLPAWTSRTSKTVAFKRSTSSSILRHPDRAQRPAFRSRRSLKNFNRISTWTGKRTAVMATEAGVFHPSPVGLSASHGTDAECRQKPRASPQGADLSLISGAYPVAFHVSALTCLPGTVRH